jgi:hypothetical protein
MYDDRQYLIIPVSELHKVVFENVLEDSVDSIRKCIDGNKTFIKWEGDAPDFVASIDGTEGPYTHEQFLQILGSSEWSKQET